MNSEKDGRKKVKVRLTISWLTLIFPVALLIVAGIYEFRKLKTSEEEMATEQTKTEAVKNAEEKAEKTVDVPAAPTTLPESDLALNEENLPDDLQETTVEEKTVEPIGTLSGYKKELASIYIPSTKSLFFASDVSIDAFRHRIAQSGHPVRGNIYYQGENGLLESFLSVDEKGMIHEILYSYDPAGHPVDEVEIGLLIPDGSTKKHAILSVNKLSIFELTTDKSANKKQERVTEYSISPQLRFKRGRTFSKLI